MRFEVTARRTTVDLTFCTVEADTPEAAAAAVQMAFENGAEGDIEDDAWREGDYVEVTKVEVVQ